MTTLPSKLIFDGDAGRYLKPSSSIYKYVIN